MRKHLFQIAIDALEGEGWTVERIAGSGKSSVRRITRRAESQVISIRTSRDTAIAFPRTDDDKSWRTLDEVDAVVAVSVDDKNAPKFAKVHIIDGDDARDRFNRAYEARKEAGHSIPVGRGVWLPLYVPEANHPVSHVGAGAGLKYPPIATVPLHHEDGAMVQASGAEQGSRSAIAPSADSPLSIAEAKRRLAVTFGVNPECIKIVIEA